MDDQRTKRRRNIAKNYNRLSRVHERYRQTTDGRATAYSEYEREFTFANKKTTARFSRLLRHLAWKWRGLILVSALHKSVTYLLT